MGRWIYKEGNEESFKKGGFETLTYPEKWGIVSFCIKDGRFLVLFIIMLEKNKKRRGN